jgi:flagellar hook-associated protein 2
MANTSSLGIGSGLDLNSLLTSIMAAERAPIKVLDEKIATTNTKISLYGTLKSKLDTLKSAAETLQFPSRLSAVSASSSDSTTASASAEYNAAIGSYNVEVTQLATTQKNVSNPYLAGTTFGPGNLDFNVAGVDAASIAISAGATLQEVTTQINDAKIGITATVITTSDGNQRMVLSSGKSGGDNTFSLNPTSALTASGAQADLTTFDATKSIIAQDALMLVDNLEIKSSTNQFSGQISGLTLTASKVGTSTITIQNDSSKIISAVQSFVDSYNAVTTLVKSNSTYNSTTKTGGAFSGDSVVRSVVEGLGSARTTVPGELSSATLQTLSALGVSIEQSGQLSLNSTTLTAAIAASPTDVTAALTAYGKSFSDSISSIEDSSAPFTSRVNSLNASIRTYQDNQTALEYRVALVEKRYRAQFTALDGLVSRMQTISASLSQSLSALSASNN